MPRQRLRRPRRSSARRACHGVVIRYAWLCSEHLCRAAGHRQRSAGHPWFTRSSHCSGRRVVWLFGNCGVTIARGDKPTPYAKHSSANAPLRCGSLGSGSAKDTMTSYAHISCPWNLPGWSCWPLQLHHRPPTRGYPEGRAQHVGRRTAVISIRMHASNPGGVASRRAGCKACGCFKMSRGIIASVYTVPLARPVTAPACMPADRPVAGRCHIRR